MKEYMREREVGRGGREQRQRETKTWIQRQTGTEAEKVKTPGECDLPQLRKKDQ